jgi:PIN domain
VHRYKRAEEESSAQFSGGGIFPPSLVGPDPRRDRTGNRKNLARHADAAERAKRARAAMERAFGDAMVSDFDKFMSAAADLPDPKDAHVVAAAIKTRASMIVTENLKDFPSGHLATLNMEAKSAAEFIADTIALDGGRAVAAIRQCANASINQRSLRKSYC